MSSKTIKSATKKSTPFTEGKLYKSSKKVNLLEEFNDDDEEVENLFQDEEIDVNEISLQNINSTLGRQNRRYNAVVDGLKSILSKLNGEENESDSDDECKSETDGLVKDILNQVNTLVHYNNESLALVDKINLFL